MMPCLKPLLAALFMVGLSGCATKSCCLQTESAVIGPIAADSLRQDYPVFEQGYGNSGVASALAVPADIEVLAYFGSWCSDSQREVPHFMRLAEASDLKVRYIGLNRTKTEPAAEIARWTITRIPTFIVLKNGTEIGRIVEQPTTTLRGDLQKILDSARHASDAAHHHLKRP